MPFPQDSEMLFLGNEFRISKKDLQVPEAHSLVG
jgi:hypothetical protein